MKIIRRHWPRLFLGFYTHGQLGSTAGDFDVLDNSKRALKIITFLIFIKIDNEIMKFMTFVT